MNHYKTDKNEICQEWRDNLAAFAKEHEFPKEAVDALSGALELTIGNGHLYDVFTQWEQNYWENPNMDYILLQNTLESLDGEEGISKYTVLISGCFALMEATISLIVIIGILLNFVLL